MRYTTIMFTLVSTCLATSSTADFLHVEVERTSCEDGIKTYRLYAVYDDPNDETHGIGSPVEFAASHPLFNDPGQLFDPTQQDLARNPLSHPRDSWATIGVDTAANNASRFRDFLPLEPLPRFSGTSFKEHLGGWYWALPAEGFRGDRTLIAQLSFEANAPSFELSGDIAWSELDEPLWFGSFSVAYAEPGSTCAADLDVDDVVGITDLLLVLSNWGPCSDACCLGDVDFSTTVGLDDLIGVLSNWGDCG